jgi:hypothetical protein
MKDIDEEVRIIFSTFLTYFADFARGGGENYELLIIDYCCMGMWKISLG